jgi:hypothetical protein
LFWSEALEATRSIGALAPLSVAGKPVVCRLALAFAVALSVASCGTGTATMQPSTQAKAASEVAIAGYDGIAMEPFVSRDGRFLLFNNSNDPGTDTDLHFARRIDDVHWTYAGPVAGANTALLEGTPAMDRAGRLFFVSLRSYAQSACTIHSAQFDEGAARNVALVDSICRHEPGVVNFDVDIDPSGTLLTFVDSHFGSSGLPQDAVLVMARWNGTQFLRSTDSATILAAVNTGTALQYAPALSADHLTLWFTRLASASGRDLPQIWRARRASETAPFDAPVRIDGLGDFVEAPALSADEKLLYFHRRVGTGFRIFAVEAP